MCDNLFTYNDGLDGDDLFPEMKNYHLLIRTQSHMHTHTPTASHTHVHMTAIQKSDYMQQIGYLNMIVIWTLSRKHQKRKN